MQGATYEGVGFEGKICGVSILRAGVASTPSRDLAIRPDQERTLSSYTGYGSRLARGVPQRAHRQDPDPAGAHSSFTAVPERAEALTSSTPQFIVTG